jgi:hypothetical protein
MKGVVFSLLVPVVAAIALLAVFTVGEMAGAAPFSYQPPRNIAEAAGMGIASETLRFMRQGEDPRQVMRIRPDIISSEITQVTALEAAIWSRRVSLVQMLEREGAIRDAAVRQYLACLAAQIRDEDLVAELRGADAGSCRGDELIRAITARAQ